MRLIWKNMYGFFLMSYPVEEDDERRFRAAIMDQNDKVWWLSDDTFKNSDECGPVAKQAWDVFLTDYCEEHEVFPDGEICKFYETMTVKALIKEKTDGNAADAGTETGTERKEKAETEKPKTDGSKSKAN